MNQTVKRGLALLMAFILCIGLLPVTQIFADAAEIEYVYTTDGKYLYNWGTRGEIATSLSPKAEAFYEDTFYNDMLMGFSGGTSTTDAPSSSMYDALRDLMATPHSYKTSYDATRDLYQYTDCQNSGEDSKAISSFYSGKAIGPAWDSGSTWNREHTWPNSKGDLAGSGENDIMMLRPTASSENGSRGNKAYGESAGYYDPNSVSGGTYNLHGDVARIVLYVYVRWGCTNTGANYNPNDIVGTEGVIESLDVLLKWMEEDPVDTWELGRNDAVQQITGTRNVFVDYPELAFVLFGADVPNDMTTPSGEAKNTVNCEHVYTSVVTAPTCTAEGYTTFTCSLCGKSYKGDYQAMLPHDYVDGVCSVCGKTEPTGTAMYIYYPAGNTYVSATLSGSRLAASADPVVWDVEIDANGYYTFSVDGLYMTSGATGNSMSMSETLTDLGRWEKTDCTGGVWLRNVGANYNGNYNQYLEYYNGFTTYGFKDTEVYVFQLINAECQHTNTEVLPAQEPTCAETGLTEGKKCSDCGTILEAQEEIPATGEHTYENGACTVCGAEESTAPSGETAYVKIVSMDELVSGQYVMIVSTGYAPGVVDGTWLSAVQPVVEGDKVTDPQGGVWTLTVDASGVTLMDANGVYVAPKGGNNNGIKTGTAYSWNVKFADGTFQFLGTGSDTVGLASNTDAQYGNKFRGYKTTTIADAAKYPSQFTLYKLTEIGETPAPECQHTNTEILPGKAATCVDTGLTEGKKCSDCGAVLTEQEEIPATGEHTYENGKCTVCGAEEPTEPEQPTGPIADGAKVVIWAPGYNKALSTTKTGNYNVGVDVTMADGVLTGYGETEVFTVIANEDGSFSFAYNGQNIGMAADYASMNLGAVNDKWELIELGDGLYLIKNTGRGNYMEWYEKYSNWSTYNSSSAATDPQFQLSFYIVEGGSSETPCEHLNTEILPGKDPTCVDTGLTEGKKCSDCGEILTAQDEIPATGEHTYENGKCTVCGAEEPTEPETPVVNKADFDTIVTSNANGDSGYKNTYTTTNGWITVNCAIQTGGAAVANPQFPVIGPDNTHKAPCLNGKTSAPGKVTSPTLTGGISKLTMQYTKMFTDTKLSVTITITDLATGTTYTQTVARDVAKDDDKYVVWDYEWVLETPITGDFTIEVVNNCPTAQDGNKDRFTILELAWESAAGETPNPGCEHTETETKTENEVAATCTESGSYDTVVYCAACGEELSRETVTVPATGHLNTVETPAVEPTKGEVGYTAGVYCNDCQTYISGHEEIPALGYTVYFVVPEGVEKVTPATCTADGIKLPAALAPEGYTFVGWSVAVVDNVTDKPTYTESGTTFTTTEDVVLYALYTYETEGEGGSTSSTYVKITTAEEFVTGTYVMIVSNGYGPTVHSSGWLNAAKPTVSDNTVTDPNGVIWTLTVSGSSVTLKDSNGNFVKPKSGNNNGITTGSYNWNWVFSNGTFQFKGTGSDTTTLACNTQSSNKFRAYKNTTVTNTTQYPSQFTLYKLTETTVPGESATYYTTVIGENACAHANTELSGVKAATCTENGYTGDLICSTCKDVLAAGEEIAATGHNYVDDVCSVCGHTLVAQIVGGEKFDSLQAAIDAAEPGATIILLNDFELTEVRISACHHAYPVYIDVQKAVAIDLNGKKITAAPTMDNDTEIGYGLIAAIYVGGEGNLTLIDSVGGGSLIVTTEKDNVYSLITVDSEEAYMAIHGGYYELNKTAAQQLIYAADGKTTEIFGGYFVLGNAAGNQQMPWIFNTFGNGQTAIKVHGGTYNVDPRHNRGDVQIVAIDSDCGLVENEDGTWTVQKHTHADAVKENIVAADCVTAGSYDLVVYCSVCGAEVSRETVIVPAAGHTGSIVPGHPATCANPGLTNGAVCGVCGVILVEQELIPALNHTEEIVEGKEATCTATGLTEGKKCSVCGEVLVAQEEIPVAGHTEEIIPAVEATCTAAGLTEGKKCSVCGEVLVAQEEVAALGHDYKSVVTDPTCYTEGYTTHTCANCGDTYRDSVTAMRQHQWDEGVIIQEPTCTMPGARKMSCTYEDCEGFTFDNLVPVVAHTEETIPAVAATCTESGLTEGKKCAVCGEILVTQEEIAATGHSFGEWTVSKEATRKEAGEETRSCACGETESREIPMIEGMNPVVIVVIVVVVLGAAAVVVFFVLKKKRA